MPNRWLRILFLALIPFSIFARKKTRRAVKKTAQLDPVRLKEAKMVDIPLPLSSVAVPTQSDEPCDIQLLSYKDKALTPDQIKNFYASEMERLGWQTKEQFHGAHESLLRFKKPHRVCVISIRFGEPKHGTQMVIFSGAKKSS